MKDNLRLWVMGCLLVTGALLAGGWFIGVAPLLSAASANDQATEQSDAQNQTLQVKLMGLRADQRNIGALRIAAAKAADAVPSSLGAQSFVGRVNALAAEDGVKVASIAPGAPIAYAQPDSGEGKIEAFLSPQVNAANFALIPMSVQVLGSAKQDRVFLGHLQHDSRLFLVNGYTLAASNDGSGSIATISGYIYALKSTPGAS